MVDNEAGFANAPVTYYPYVEPEAGAGKGMLAVLGRQACVVVTDDFPAFMLPRMLAAGARQTPVLMEAVDSNGLLPLRATSVVYPTAYAFRRFLQKTLTQHLQAGPKAKPLAGVKLPALRRLPDGLTRRWPRVRGKVDVGELPIDHRVGATKTAGGSRAAVAAMKAFFERKLARYGVARNQPEEEVTSGLSPYLHFGHISAHQVLHEISRRTDWSAGDVAERANGKKEGWWRLPPAIESFLDELVTWRELGFNMCWQREDYDQYESLPAWARATLEKHAKDRRPKRYSLRQFEQGETHDPLWNAAQAQLVREGRIHNYLRMLWGKKVLEWSDGPRDALEILIELNNKYALDGRDPNSYSGIFWCLGRYDRPWFPERPIFGNIRYMSSENTARKFTVKNYIARYSG